MFSSMILKGPKQGHAPTSEIVSSTTTSTTIIVPEITTSTNTTTVTETETTVETTQTQNRLNFEAQMLEEIEELEEIEMLGVVEPVKVVNGGTTTSSYSTSMYSTGPMLAAIAHEPAKVRRSGRPESEDKLIIGIDFGTTYTGVAYAFTTDTKDIRAINEWEGEHASGRNDVVKVPSLIKYTTSDSFTWGYHVDASEPGLIRGIKLSLDPGKREAYQKTAALMGGPNPFVQSQLTVNGETARLHKGTVDIVADYIGAVYEYAMSKILEKGMAGHIKSLKKEFVLTVPAIWSEEAKTATWRAARKAHPDFSVLTPADLITEPEAAALCTLHAFSDKGLTTGDVFVLCDAGGGTVDLISYQIVATHPKLELKEIVAPSGGLVGSMMLNEAFERYLRTTLGEEQFRAFVDSEDHEFHVAMEEFESIVKPRFSNPEEWTAKFRKFSKVKFGGVRIRDDPANNIVKNVLTITGKTLSDIFDPLISDIEVLVQKQLDQVHAKMDFSAKAVFLVGGFGASPYLKKRLQKLAAPIDIINPVDAWSAVVRGAVLSKIPNAIRVVAAIAPKSYGVRANNVFLDYEHKKDAAAHKVWDEYEGIYRIPMMSWYIVKGDDLLRDRTHSVSFHNAIPLDYSPEDLIFESELEECEADCPSPYPWTNPLRISCKVTCDFRHLSKSQLELVQPPSGLKHYSLKYELVVSTGAALRTFSVKFDGVLYSTVKVAYD